MKVPMRFGALVLAFAGSTIAAKAECVGGDFGDHFVVCAPSRPPVPVEQPKERHQQAPHPTPVHHLTKRPNPNPEGDKAPPAPARPPPALPPQ